MIATTIEQSKYLLELGLDPKTADMYYVRKVTDFMGNRIENPKWSVSKYGSPNSKHASYIVQNFTDFEILPAWSLSALLEVMPPFIKGHHLKIEKTRITNMWYLDYQYLTDSEPRKDLLTAAYEMVCWLLTNNLIKKGDNDE